MKARIYGSKNIHFPNEQSYRLYKAAEPCYNGKRDVPSHIIRCHSVPLSALRKEKALFLNVFV